jgi:aryl-alcohol dehydrogenase-like predicted oxidoreductase
VNRRWPRAGHFHGIDTRPIAVKNFLAYSLKRLGVEVIDIYRPARLDPAVPIEDTIGAIADLVKAGYVRHIGLSEVASARRSTGSSREDCSRAASRRKRETGAPTSLALLARTGRRTRTR